MNDAPHFLKPAELTRLCDFLYRRTGMLFGESKRYYIDRRVADRVGATKSLSFADYYGHLLASEDEVELLINSFTVNETYFYREEHQLQALSQDILPAIIRHKRPGDRIRIWSAPCSTGEEPYSIALWLLENWRLVDAYNVEIVGSDIDTAALRHAVLGEYGERALARLSPAVRREYFEPVDSEHWRIIADLRESVAFRPVNLVDRDSTAAEGQFDVIFCRNVLIYFDDQARERAVDNLYRAMLPGAFICLGHTESMARISSRFTVSRFNDAIVYRRPEDS